MSKLVYQPALPISNGSLALWLFLSTEVMFFTALVGTCIVLRLGTPAGIWPTPDQVHLSLAIGVINTVILILSSFTMAWASVQANLQHSKHSKQSKQCALWLLITMVLGSAFLCLTGYDYAVKYSRGVAPGLGRSKMHDQADLVFLDAVKRETQQRLESLAQTPNKNAAWGSLTYSAIDPVPNDGLNHAQRLQLILSGLVDWTEKKIGRSADPLMQQRSLEALAYQINPTSFAKEKAQAVAKFLRDEKSETAVDLIAVTDRLADCQTQLRAAQAKIKQSTSIERDTRRLSPNATDDALADADDLLDSLKQTAGQLTSEITRLTSQRDALSTRIEATEIFDLDLGGINQRFGLNLPAVISGGNAWANSYLLLTAAHSLHVVIGLLVLAAMLPGVATAGSSQHQRNVGPGNIGLGNVGLYWHFVTAIWIVLFGLIYLI